ncbi:MAG TPA: FAD-dependent oxidoreductase [Candidatus Nanoarchaeia archaeon]|nr:FAD-dependent oxidoreductase [Candidatus Nanoarchaeia archaeon]
MSRSKYVIVGGCAAGIGAVEAIREIDQQGTITVISEEQCSHYSRPMISDFVSGKVDLAKMKTRDDEFWQKNSVNIFVGKKAVTLNTDERTIFLDDGEKIAYEKLLLATGGKPFVPKMEGQEKEGVYTFTNVADAERLSNKINKEKAKSAVVIGAGLIGISVTEALVKRGVKVTLVELQDKILSLLLDSKASDLVEAIVRKAGVNIVTGQSVQKITGKPENDVVVGGVVLTKGDTVMCDMVIVAIGVIPRTELVIGTAVKTNRGIVVDNYMQTNVPNIYASGDVAEAYDFILNQNRLLPLWPLAVLEGKVAGYNMAGKKTDYSGGTNMSSLKYFGIPIVSIGLANPKDDPLLEILTVQDISKGIYKKLVLKSNIIVGMTFLGDIERAGIYYYLLKNKVNVAAFKQALLSDDFSLAALPGELLKEMKVEA